MLGGVATFIGGSLGGKTQYLHEIQPRYLAPVPLSFPFQQVRGFISGQGTLRAPWDVVFPVDEYRLERTKRSSTEMTKYVYHWIRPDIEGMQKKIRTLEARVAELEKPPLRQGLMRFSR